MPPVPMQPLMVHVRTHTLRVFSSLLMQRGTGAKFLKGHDDEDGCLLTQNLWERAFLGAELARDGDDTV